MQSDKAAHGPERSRPNLRDLGGGGQSQGQGQGQGQGPGGKTDRSPLGESSRQISSGNPPRPAAHAPGPGAVEGTSLKSGAQVRLCRPQPRRLPTPDPRPSVSPSAHWQTSAEHNVDKNLLLRGAP